MKRKRLKIEQQILKKYFPNRYAFVGLNSSQPYLDLGLQSNDKNVFRFKIMLKKFPANVPEVFIKYPKNIKNYNGEKLTSIGPSHSMHLLSPRNGIPQVCHFKSKHWHPNRTLYNVALKLRFWMEAYEGHLNTGKPLTYYVTD